MSFEKQFNNKNEKISEMAADVKQSILDLIKFKNYGGLSADQINDQLSFIKRKIESLVEENDPSVEDLKSLVNQNFSSFTNGNV